MSLKKRARIAVPEEWARSSQSCILELSVRAPGGAEAVLTPLDDGVCFHAASIAAHSALEYLRLHKTSAWFRVPLLAWLESSLRTVTSRIREVYPTPYDVGGECLHSSFESATRIGVGAAQDPPAELVRAFQPPLDRAALERVRRALETRGWRLVRKTGMVVEFVTGKRRWVVPRTEPWGYRSTRSFCLWSADVAERDFVRILHAVSVSSEVSVPARAALRVCEAFALLGCLECGAAHFAQSQKNGAVAAEVVQILQTCRALLTGLCLAHAPLPDELVHLCVEYAVSGVDRKTLFDCLLLR